MKNELSQGQQLAAAVMPFMTSAHTCSREELTRMIADPVDRMAHVYEDLLNKCVAFIQGERVHTKGLTYHKDINSASFIAFIEAQYK